MVVLDGQQHFSMWHIFLIVCAIPTVLAIIGLLLLPESPRILLAIGHEREALVIYQVRHYSHLTISPLSLSLLPPPPFSCIILIIISKKRKFGWISQPKLSFV